jgi:hypothetical protein
LWHMYVYYYTCVCIHYTSIYYTWVCLYCAYSNYTLGSSHRRPDKKMLRTKALTVIIISFCCCLHRPFFEIAEGQQWQAALEPLFSQVNSWRGIRRPRWVCGFKVAGATHSRSGGVCAGLEVVEYFVMSRPPCQALLTDCDRLPWHWQVERLHGNCNSSRPTSTYNWTWSRR